MSSAVKHLLFVLCFGSLVLFGQADTQIDVDSDISSESDAPVKKDSPKKTSPKKTNQTTTQKEKPQAKQTQTIKKEEKPYEPFPYNQTKGIQEVPEHALANWQKSRRVALIVGVSNYPNGSGLARLNFGASDSQKLASVLKTVGKFDEVVLLNDEESSSKKELNPTKENILKQRDRLLEQDPSTFLFYFSGHGFEYNQENVITPIDTIMGTNNETPKNTIVVNSEIIEPAKEKGVGQVIVFIDACRETLREGKAGSGLPFAEFPEKIQKARGVGIRHSSGWIFL